MKFFLPMVEFYITNVCNLTCRGCNRFNNYKFKGHQYWDDHASAIERWSQRLDIEHVWILGGEPTLNPDLKKWANNLRRLWPLSKISIQTNGTQFKPDADAYYDDYKVGWGVALHDKSTADDIKIFWHKAGIFEAFDFHQATIIEEDQHFVVHNSDPTQAFNCCDMKHDHTIFNGKLYKCPAMSGLKEFQSQFDLRLSVEQQTLLDAYTPLDATCSDAELERFLKDRDSPIPQCSFCPQELKWHTAIENNSKQLT